MTTTERTTLAMANPATNGIASPDAPKSGWSRRDSNAGNKAAVATIVASIKYANKARLLRADVGAVADPFMADALSRLTAFIVRDSRATNELGNGPHEHEVCNSFRGAGKNSVSLHRTNQGRQIGLVYCGAKDKPGMSLAERTLAESRRFTLIGGDYRAAFCRCQSVACS